jgi:DNA-binding beta-propeller fold protein YncE
MTRVHYLSLALVISSAFVQAQTTSTPALPNMGQDLTPQGTVMQLNPGLSDQPDWTATHAVTSVVSPDRNTLLVLTSGFNRIYDNPLVNPIFPGGAPLTQWTPADSTEHVFVYDISTGTPSLKQVVPIQITIQFPTGSLVVGSSTYSGIVFDPTGGAFYVGGGPDDVVHIFVPDNTGVWGEAANSPLALNHKVGLGLNVLSSGPVAINEEASVTPCAAGVAISSDSKTLVVANYANDSITIFDRAAASSSTWSAGTELDLRPGKSNAAQSGVPGGEYPFWVVIKGAGSSATAYVSSVRDREIEVVNLTLPPSVAARIPVKGQPNKMTLNMAQSLLYVAEDQSDTVDVIDTTKNVVLESIPVVASMLPASLAQSKFALKGANPNSVTLSPDETQLYVTNGNLNCVAVIALGGASSGDQVIGLIPTGWYPNSTSVNWLPNTASFSSNDSVYMYVVNGKSPTGANPLWCYGGYGPGPPSKNCMTTNQYNPQRTKAGLASFPLPGTAQLATLTAQVSANDRFSFTESDNDAAIMTAVHKAISHVIYILKENRTYDQILGDLPVVGGTQPDGDSTLTEFGAAITPNEHNLAQNFVTLDRFFTTAEISVDGWLWSTSAQAPDVVQKTWPIAYAYRGLSIESEGLNRNVNVAIPTVAGRLSANPLTPADPDLLPGQTDVAAPDGPNNEINTGYLWNNALRAGLTVRSYGFFIDGTRYSTPTNEIPLARNPFATGTIQAISANAALAPYTDPYFRGFDNALPDFYRYAEWEREFNFNYSSGGLPALSLVRFMHDHTGNFAAGKGGSPPAAIDGVNTPELMVADNDYAVGMLIQKIANSIYANDTLIFVVEDDAQDGGDHVDSHRSVALVAGPYVKQGAVISTPYNTINFVRTMEEVLGLAPMNLNDALAAPMADIFNMTDLVNGTPTPWSFAAAPSAYLYNTQLLLPPKPVGLKVPKPTHNAKYWARVTKGMDFTDADLVDPAAFNRILWKGLMGNQPYPAGLKQEADKERKADKD